MKKYVVLHRYIRRFVVFVSVGLLATTVLVGAESIPSRKSIQIIAKEASGAVVSIVMSDKDGHPVAQGSGFLVSKDGSVVTNYHVIAHGASAVVKLPSGAFYAVDGVIASDEQRDLAVIKVHGSEFRTVILGNSDRVKVGEEVVAIGNPLSLESTVSNEIVSGVRRADKFGGTLLQITTPISPGSSGGPLFSMAGEVVGITTSHLEGGENLNFAIPINDAKRLLQVHVSKLQDFPDEAKSAKLETHSTAAAGTTTARRYYQELYDHNGFIRPDFFPPDYVCFSVDTNSDSFFTFDAWAFDKDYCEAIDELLTSPLPSPEKQEKDHSTMDAIERGAPYVNFLDTMSLSSYSSEGQQYFRKGGRLLNKYTYSKGVKIKTLQFRWDGGVWVVRDGPDDKGLVRTYYLTIEPSTLRYDEKLVFRVGKYIVDPKIALNPEKVSRRWGIAPGEGQSAGICEKIPPRK